jgi:hypothetical protein
LRHHLIILTIILTATLLPFSGLPTIIAPDEALAGDGTCGEACAECSHTWYFAEGYTGDGFQEWVCILNPQETVSHLKMDILYNSENPRRIELDLPPRSRNTLDINSQAGMGREVSLYLEASEPIVAERPIYFTYRSKWKGCTVTGGSNAPAPSWYFAEGCTRPGFEEWILMSNPWEETVPARVFLILDDGEIAPVSLNLPPKSRQTVSVNHEVGEGRDVGARVEAEKPICAERAMYFNYHGAWPGGHASSGLSQPRKTYLFAEGYTGPGFEEWLCLYLPGETGVEDEAGGADVSINCLFPEGEEQAFTFHLDPDRRQTININQLVGRETDVSLELSSHVPFLAERPMYFNYRGYCRGGHVSRGAEEAGTHWYLAEGTLRGGYYTYLCLMNPGNEYATVLIDYIDDSNWSEVPNTDSHEFAIPPRSRITISPQPDISIGDYGDVSFDISSNHPIAVERPVYYPSARFEVLNTMDHIWNLSVVIGQRVEGTAADEATVDYLTGVLNNYGYQVEIQDVPLPNGSFTHNVIAYSSPTWAVHPDYRKYLAVGAHYDTRIGTGSPGANDNGSGAAVVLELARCFAERRPSKSTIIFILFGGEELLTEGTDQHHFGSRHYVQQLTPYEIDHCLGAIVVDMVGVGSQLYARTMGVGPMDLCNSLMSYASDAGVFLPYMKSGSYSDHEPFENAGMPAVWLEVKDDPWYHTAADSYDKIDPAHIESTGHLLEGFIRFLQNTL